MNQLSEVQKEEESFETLNKELFTNNFQYVINNRFKLETCIKRVNDLLCKSDTINKSKILYESLLKLVSCNQQQ